MSSCAVTKAISLSAFSTKHFEGSNTVHLAIIVLFAKVHASAVSMV